MGGGAWPFLVGGVICLVNSVNERDLDLLNSYPVSQRYSFLEGLIPIAGNFTKKAFRHHVDENFRQINVQLSCTLDHLCGAHNTQQPSLKI